MRNWNDITVDTMTPAEIKGDKHIKTVEFETYTVDKDDNIIGIKITNEDGKKCNKRVEDCGNGNHVAVAMEVLYGLEIPLGTKIKVNIEIEKEKLM